MEAGVREEKEIAAVASATSTNPAVGPVDAPGCWRRLKQQQQRSRRTFVGLLLRLLLFPKLPLLDYYLRLAAAIASDTTICSSSSSL